MKRLCIAAIALLLMNCAAKADDADKAKTALYRCVAQHLALVDDGISAPAQIGAAAAQFCQPHVIALADALNRTLGGSAGDVVFDMAREGKMFATLVLMRRVELRRRQSP